MNESEFKDVLDKLAATNSRNEKKSIIKEVQDCPAAISFLSGSEFDNAGLGKKTVHNVAQEALGSFEAKPTVSEALDRITTQTSQEGSKGLWILRDDMEQLAKRSGNDMEDYLFQMFAEYDYPSVVAHACLDDWPTGTGDSTIASALDLKDSLPFYDSVADAAEAPNPVEKPLIHNAFDPMLAKSESSLPDNLSNYVAQPKLDGYRLLIHIRAFNEDGGQKVKAFTRRRNDVTESLPELQEIDWPDGDYILDCEVIAETGDYSDTSERIGRKAENVSREVEMQFALFDVLVFDYAPVYDKMYKERYGLTTTVADLTSDERVGALPIFTDVEKAKEVASNYEGLIWKLKNAPYEFGKRSKSWVKEKHMAKTIDAIAVGFEEGEGRLDGTLGKIALETADGHSLGATGSGLTDAQRDKVWNNQDSYLGEPLEVEAEGYDDNLRFPIFQRWRSDDGEADDLKRVKEILPET